MRGRLEKRGIMGGRKGNVGKERERGGRGKRNDGTERRREEKGWKE